MEPVTFAEIRDWLADRPVWPQEILKAIARAADRNDHGRISANDLRTDPEFHIADNQVNTIPAMFGMCRKYGWLRKAGYVTSTSFAGHQCEVKLYEVTPEGRAAFERLVEIGAGEGTSTAGNQEPDGQVPVSPPVASPDLGEPTPACPRGESRPPSGDTVADSDGRQDPGVPSEPLTLPGFEQLDASYVDHDQRKAA